MGGFFFLVVVFFLLFKMLDVSSQGEERGKEGRIGKNKTCIIGCGWILKMGGTQTDASTHTYTEQHQQCPALNAPSTKETG